MFDTNLVKIIKIDNVYAKIVTEHPSLLNDVSNYFTVYVEGYKFMPKYKMGIWDGKLRFIERDGTFLIGLLNSLYKFIKNYDIKIELDLDLVNNNVDFEDEFNNITTEWLVESITPRDYQLEGAIKAIKYKRGILEHATAAGKSLTIAMILKYLELSNKCKKMMILVPTAGLVEQMYSDFLEYGIEEKLLGRFYEKEKNIDRLITISTWQSMHVHKDLINEFDCIITDECHTQRANVVRSVLLNSKNAIYRIGTSGTVDLHKSQKWLIEGVLGPVIHNIPPAFLIDNGYASDVKVNILFLQHKEADVKKLKGMPYQEEKTWIQTCNIRNKIIRKLIKKHQELDHNVLILFDHIEHGNFIKESLKDLEQDGAHIFMVTGETPAKERERIRKFTNENKKVILLGTYGVLSTGVNINRLNALIFSVAGKSMIRILQSIGRGMRLHHEKNGVRVYDICDSFKYSEKHLSDRLTIYDKAGYKVDVNDIIL